MYVVLILNIHTYNISLRYIGNYRSSPPADESQDLTFASALHENGVTSVIFSRERVTNDSNDVPLDQCVYFLYAWGGTVDVNTQVIQQHMYREASRDMICLPSSIDCPSEWNA